MQQKISDVDTYVVAVASLNGVISELLLIKIGSFLPEISMPGTGRDGTGVT